MKLKFHLYTVLLFLVIITAWPTEIIGQCFEKNFAFQEGEILNYDVVYNWRFIWLNAGEVEFSVSPLIYDQREVYHLNSYGKTLRGYDWFFKVRDDFTSYLDKKNLKPLWFKRDTYEGGYKVDNNYVFDNINNKIYTYTQNSKKPYVEDTLAKPECIFDVLSLIYYCRNLDFKGMEINDTLPVVSIIDNEIFNLYIRYLGKVKLEMQDKKEYTCIKFSALLVEGTIFKGGEDLIVWVTDDKNRIPIMVEAKILVGSVKAILSGAEGLKNPSSLKNE